MRLSSSALLASILVVLGVDAHPARAPFISIPIQRVGPRTDVPPLPPTIVHQQHANRAIRRLEHLSGATTRTPDDVLLLNLQRRAAALPAHIQKRFYHPALDALLRVPKAGKHAHADPGKGGTQAKTQEGQNFKAGQTDSDSEGEDEATRDGVTPAKKPIFKNTIGLDIQSSDIGYIGKVQIGTPPRNFNLLMDSGSADLWVGAEGCVPEDPWDDQEDCGAHTFLGPKSSSTFNDTKKAWKIQYGTGAVSGTIVTDHIAFAGLKLPKYKFGVADKESAEFTPDYIPFDGLAGLAKAPISRQGTVPIVEALHRAGLIAEPIASYHIPRRADAVGGYSDGELTLGALNPARYQKDTLVKVPNVSPIGFWEARLDGVHVGGKNMRWSTRQAIFDTGTTLLIAPPADVNAIHAHIPGAYFDPDGHGGWTVPCVPTYNKNQPVMTLVLGGRAFDVDARDIAFLPVDAADPQGNCTSGISAGDVGGEEVWLVGDVFLKNVYMSTNVDDDSISFAKLKK